MAPSKISQTKFFKIVKKAFGDLFGDDIFTLSAALAFYTALSLAPLLVIIILVLSWLGYNAQHSLIEQVHNLMGRGASDAVELVLKSANLKPELRSIAGWFSIGTLAFSATAVLAQLQSSLNLIWDVEAAPGLDIKGWIKKRFFSFGLILCMAFLLMVSAAISAFISFLVHGEGTLWILANNLVSVLVFTALFALMFEYLPDVRIPWRKVWVGAFITSVLFILGKYLIGLYLGTSSVGSAYGAAGSLIVLLVWVYYSSVILFLGAEITQAISVKEGLRIIPEEHAKKASA